MSNKFVIEPADLAELTEAFEVAWTMVEAKKCVPLIYALVERDRLGEIVLATWNADRDCDLAAKAVDQFFATLTPRFPGQDLTQPINLGARRHG